MYNASSMEPRNSQEEDEQLDLAIALSIQQSFEENNLLVGEEANESTQQESNRTVEPESSNDATTEVDNEASTSTDEFSQLSAEEQEKVFFRHIVSDKFRKFLNKLRIYKLKLQIIN